MRGSGKEVIEWGGGGGGGGGGGAGRERDRQTDSQTDRQRSVLCTEIKLMLHNAVQYQKLIPNQIHVKLQSMHKALKALLFCQSSMHCLMTHDLSHSGTNVQDFLCLFWLRGYGLAEDVTWCVFML